MGRRALAEARQPGPRRPELPAEGVEGRRALRHRPVLRLRPRDQRAARRRQVDRPHGVGPVGQPGRHPAHPQAARQARRQGDVLRSRRDRYALSRRAARAGRRGPRDRHPWLDPRAQFGAAARGRARPDASLGGHAGEDHRQALRRHAHAVVGLQPQHAGARAGARPAVRQLPDGRRGLLRADAARQGNRHRRAAGRMGARRRGLLLDAPLLRASALHPADRRARHLPPRARCGLRGGRHLPAHHASAHHRLPLAHLDRRRADPPRQVEGPRKNGVWFATHAEVAAYAKAHAA